jgi:hypothetical protein
MFCPEWWCYWSLFGALCSTTLRTRTEMVFETLVSTKLNHLTRLIIRENLIIVKKSPPFMEPQSSSPCSHEPDTGPSCTIRSIPTHHRQNPTEIINEKGRWNNLHQQCCASLGSWYLFRLSRSFLLVRNPELQLHVHICSILELVLSQFNPFHTIVTHLS